MEGVVRLGFVMALTGRASDAVRTITSAIRSIFMVRRSWAACGVCPRTVRKWVDRYRREGLAGLQDRSSRPHRLRQPTSRGVVEEIEQLRR